MLFPFQQDSGIPPIYPIPSTHAGLKPAALPSSMAQLNGEPEFVSASILQRREKRRVERCEKCEVPPRRYSRSGDGAVRSGFAAERDNGGAVPGVTCARGHRFGGGGYVSKDNQLAESPRGVLFGGRGYVGFQKGATYDEIKAYVLEKFGLKVSSLYISQVKRKYGLEVGPNYNPPKSWGAEGAAVSARERIGNYGGAGAFSDDLTLKTFV